ncbi:hypothetical protein EVAR_64011_1 [Eumeta japonica]|uniref:Uncharacterized protein n=1 Tax=Eumeta variegata TaxID=151549 RepID=A0A4C1Z334_EUMVA|nr:hypothetical protein EVAR_64011_1 [Eumeta japonica]
MIEPIVLYCCAWAPATSKDGVWKMLKTEQHSVSLKACRVHQTACLHSALILSSLPPFDIRVREATWFYDVKRAKDLADTFFNRKLEKPVYFRELFHSAHVPKIGFECVKQLSYFESFAIVGPHVYTGCSRIEGKIGAALTE